VDCTDIERLFDPPNATTVQIPGVNEIGYIQNSTVKLPTPKEKSGCARDVIAP
jgi:hypothetical protein